MGAGVALVVGIVFGFVVIVAVALWIIVRGRLSARAGYFVIAILIVGSNALAIVSGSFRSAILLILGMGVGLALSSVVTLPLRATYTRRWGDVNGRRPAS